MPCILKPHRSVAWGTRGFRRFRVLQATGLDGVEHRYPSEAYPVLVQEQIHGDGEGIFLLMDRGRRIAAFAHRRRREKPPWGGVSTYRESVPPPLDLLAPSERLLESVRWHGVAMVEFKRCRSTGRGYLMEVNGRLWGSLQLAIDAGVDFPSLMVRVALGKPVELVSGYRLGVRSRWWWGDVDHMLARVRHPRASARAGVQPTSILAALWDFAHLWRSSDRFEVWDPEDSRPFWQETLDWFRGRGA